MNDRIQDESTAYFYYYNEFEHVQEKATMKYTTVVKETEDGELYIFLGKLVHEDGGAYIVVGKAVHELGGAFYFQKNNVDP